MKMKEFGPPGGGARPWRPPLDPPMVSMYKDEWWHCCTACVRPCSHLTSAIAFYRPQMKFAKVMFLQVSVCPQLGGVRGCSGGWWDMHGCSGGHQWLLGGHAWLLWGACMVALGGMHGFFGGHAWFFPGGMHGFCLGACMVFSGGCACFFLGGAWFFPGGVHVFFLEGGIHRIRRDTVNERAVRILLECILVSLIFAVKCRY